MDIFETIRTRRSVRNFDSSKKITRRQIEKLLQAAWWAPSAGNLRSRVFIVVEDQEVKEKLVGASLNQTFIAQAPVVIVSCADLEKSATRYGERGRSLYALQDASIASQNILLAATGMGLGSVWVGAFDERKVSQILDLPKSLRPIAIIPIGYPKRR